MNNQVKKECPICGAEAVHTTQGLGEVFVECSACGRFEYKAILLKSEENENFFDKLASYLYYNGKINPPIVDDRFFNYLGPKESFDKIYHQYPWCNHVTKELVDSWYPKTFSEKVDLFLLGLSSRINYVGEVVLFSQEQLESACFVLRNPGGPWRKDEKLVKNQVQYFIKYLVDQGFVETGPYQFVLLPKGYERIDVLQKNMSKNTKNVFVAMSFAPEMTEVREAIKKALLECGFVPRIMDEIEHNHQIVPEMLYEIREARFVIAELTGHNNGAYFEAGYALGFGKDVIQICKKSKFGEDGHFDVKQVNSVLWDNTEDLTMKLSARIKATIL